MVGCGTHLVVAATTGLGSGSDCPAFGRLLQQARRRCRRAGWVLADAGYDSEASHAAARRLRIKAAIPPLIGRRVRRVGVG